MNQRSHGHYGVLCASCEPRFEEFLAPGEPPDTGLDESLGVAVGHSVLLQQLDEFSDGSRGMSDG